MLTIPTVCATSKFLVTDTARILTTMWTLPAVIVGQIWRQINYDLRSLGTSLWLNRRNERRACVPEKGLENRKLCSLKFEKYISRFLDRPLILGLEIRPRRTIHVITLRQKKNKRYNIEVLFERRR